jgi:hypothetical protein
MKRESLGWIVAGIVTVLTCTLGAMQRPGGEIGRYQVVPGKSLVDTKQTMDTFVLLDTATAKSWTLLMQTTNKNMPNVVWVSVEGP